MLLLLDSKRGSIRFESIGESPVLNSYIGESLQRRILGRLGLLQG